MLKTDNTMGNCKRLIIQWTTAKGNTDNSPQTNTLS